MHILEAIILGVIQGIAEFLPISSSGHLLLLPELVEKLGLGLDFSFQDRTFDITLHIATFIAILFFYRKKIIQMGFSRSRKQNRKFFTNLVLTSIPALILGGVLYVSDINIQENKYLATISLIIFGIVLIVMDFYDANGKKKVNNISKTDAAVIGIFQSLSMIRGVSRSGATLFGTLVRGVQRKEAVDYVFIASIPLYIALTGVQILEFLLDNSGGKATFPEIAAGFSSSLIVGIISIILLRGLIQKRGLLALLGVYRIVLGIILLIVFLV